MVVKTPVDSTTYLAPAEAHLMAEGSLDSGKINKQGLRNFHPLKAPQYTTYHCFLYIPFSPFLVKLPLSENSDGVSVNNELSVLCLHLTLVHSVGRVILEHVHHVI